RHPLQRALRADKLTLGALEATLAVAIDAPEQIPVVRMLRESPETVRARATPLTELPSFACAVGEELAAKLRACDPPMIALVRDGRTLLDCRTLADDEIEEVA